MPEPAGPSVTARQVAAYRLGFERRPRPPVVRYLEAETLRKILLDLGLSYQTWSLP